MVAPHNGWIVCVIPPDEDAGRLPPDEPNAHLIASAPELLAVVERLLYKVNGLNATERATNPAYSGSTLCAELTATIKQASEAVAGL